MVDLHSGLTLGMRGIQWVAKPAVGCPLDGGVMPLAAHDAPTMLGQNEAQRPVAPAEIR